MKKRTLSLMFAVLLTFAVLCIPAFAVVDKSDDFYVADYANVLSTDTKSSIINYNGALEKQCDGAQIVVVTVDYLDGMSSSEYATQLFNNWGVGSSKSNNGVLLLLATQENKYYVEYGTGLTGTSFETEVGGKMSKFEKYFDGGEYDKAVSYIFGEMMNWFDDEYGSAVASSGNTNGYDGQSSYHNNVFSYGGVISLLIRLFIIYLFVAAIFRSFRRSYHTRTGNWLPLFLLFGPRIPFWGYRPGSHYDPHNFNDWDDHHHGGFGGGSGFGGGGFGGGGFGGGGFGGGMGGGGGGFGGGGFGRN